MHTAVMQLSLFVYTILISPDIYTSKRAFCSAGDEAISSVQITFKPSPFVAEKQHICLRASVVRSAASDTVQVQVRCYPSKEEVSNTACHGRCS